MNAINASDLKTQGINAITMALANTQEVAISVQGKPRFIVMDIDHYQQLREYELEIAVQKANADIAAGRFVTESANDYMNRIIKEYDLQPDYSWFVHEKVSEIFKITSRISQATQKSAWVVRNKSL